MPIYEYECQHCRHIVEAFQKFSDEPLTQCPECHQTSLQKIVSSTTFQLKGTGWYATDIRDKGKAPAAKTETNEGSHQQTKNEDTAKNKDSKSTESSKGDD